MKTHLVQFWEKYKSEKGIKRGKKVKQELIELYCCKMIQYIVFYKYIDTIYCVKGVQLNDSYSKDFRKLQEKGKPDTSIKGNKAIFSKF